MDNKTRLLILQSGFVDDGGLCLSPQISALEIYGNFRHQLHFVFIVDVLANGTTGAAFPMTFLMRC